MLFDTNIWIALAFSAHPHHKLASKVFAEASADNLAYYCRSTEQSFLRIATTPQVLRAYGCEGFRNQDAMELIKKHHLHPLIGFLREPEGIREKWYELAKLPSSSPKVWMDAYLASFAIYEEQELITMDRDFLRYLPHGLKLRLLHPA